MVKFKNNGIKSDDFDKIVRESNKLYKEYNLHNYDVEVIVSKRFGTKTNGNIKVRRDKVIKISLNHKVYKHIGIDAVIGTVKHEFAHLIAYNEIGVLDHGNRFKEVCLKLGGHMNDKFAQGKFTACSNKEFFLPSEMKKYKLTCGVCGNIIRRDRLNKNLLNNNACLCGNRLRNFNITQNH